MNIKRLTDFDMEKCVLGSILVDGNLIYTCSLKPDDFYLTAHKEIFKIMQNMKEKNIPIDTATVSEEIKKAGKEEKIGGITYLFTLTNYLPTALNFESYEKVVREKSIKRKLWRVIKKIEDKIESDKEIEDILDDVEKIFNIDYSEDNTTTTYSVLGEIWDAISSKHLEVFLPSGIAGIDNLIGGFTRQSLNIIASRPSIGKSSVVLQIALAQANSKKPRNTLIFSLEMDKKALVRRMLSHISNVPHRKIQFNTLSEKDLERLSVALSKISNAPIFINDSTNLSVGDIERIAMRWKKTHGLDFIIVDYMQLLKTPKREKRVDEVSYLSRALKLMARRLDVVVIALSQLNREAEKRADKRPSLHDLRESGSIEQDADVVILIWRKPNDKGLPSNEGEFIVAKNRDGKIGSVPFVFHNETLRFETFVGGDDIELER